MKLRGLFFLLAVSCAHGATVSNSAPAHGSAITTANSFTFTPDPATPGITIPLDFVGISFEESAIVQNPSLNNNANMKAILSVLGTHSVVRFGGNTSDTNVPLLSRTTDAANFVNSFGSGWSMIYGVSCTQNNPTLAGQQATNISGVLGARVIYQIGNEPNLYGSGPCQGFANYQTIWQSVHNAIVAAVPAATFAGADIGFDANFPDTWTALFHTNLGSQAALYSIHAYGGAATGNVATDCSAAWGNTLNPAEFIAAPAIATPIRVTESGSIGGSNVGIANTLCASLYDLWQMILLAQNGWAGVNWHEGDGTATTAGYIPFSSLGGSPATYQAESTLYAMVMFNYLTGGQILPVTTTLPASVPYLAVKLGGNVNILIVNKSLTNYNAVRIGSTASFSTASVLMYTAPSYSSVAPNITLGASTIASNGSFSPSTYIINKVGSTATINIPASSAVLVTLNP